MKTILVTLSAILMLCALTACGDQKFEGRTAQEWAAEAKKQAAARAAPPAASAVVKVDDGAEQAKRKQQQDAADDSYLSVVDQQVAIIDNQKEVVHSFSRRLSKPSLVTVMSGRMMIWWSSGIFPGQRS